MQNCFKKLMKEDNFDKIFGVFNFFIYIVQLYLVYLIMDLCPYANLPMFFVVFICYVNFLYFVCILWGKIVGSYGPKFELYFPFLMNTLFFCVFTLFLYLQSFTYELSMKEELTELFEAYKAGYNINHFNQFLKDHKCCGLEDSKTWRNFNHPYPSACCGFVNFEKNCTELEPSFQKEGCLLVYSRKLHNYINVLGSTCISSVILFVIAYIIYEEKIYTILKKPKTRNKEAANPI